ncbi:hypothetical protein PCANC_27849 [Puccinia coronata f. sp. avenae]|uniref:Protein phosphatase methylesterase 1 n=1 Tax=Puccinia coronata f. sp. avenae TaxID=200324 RepID=A0A2N5TCD2_9BASI|nr:hypothetical protein PCANC_27849 [Puccinia coronata f. sp. avenae]
MFIHSHSHSQSQSQSPSALAAAASILRSPPPLFPGCAARHCPAQPAVPRLLQPANPEPDHASSPIVFVFHHGAGYSGLSAACLAREVRASQVKSPDQASPDLSLPTLASDMVDLLRTMYPHRPHAPAFVLVGHSMGGAVATEACAGVQEHVGRVIGLVVLDVVEGSALSALTSMMPLINARPSSFGSPAECIKYHVDSHTIRNLASARISVPSLIRNSSASSAPSASHPATEDASADPPDTIGSEERFEWITDLRRSQPHWEGWYRGLSAKFLAQKTARLLVLAGTDRLDKELMIGQMQGKYQLSVLANVGHCVHEDDPAALADLLVGFADRNDAASSDQILARLGKKPLQKIPPPVTTTNTTSAARPP